MSYKSPIEIICENIRSQMENDVYSIVQSYGVNVDKEELIKALEYDREQYQKGYEDGITEEQTAKMINQNEGFFSSHGVCICGHCSQCGNTVCDEFRYCPYCGARLECER